MRGDLTAPATLDECQEDIDAVFLVWTASAGAAPAAVDRMAKQGGVVVMTTSPKQFDEIIKNDTERYSKMFQAAGLGAK